ncbi:Uncharacterised protein [Escherichia coli]|nr:Uncharacterised protein [Escherichia coli]CTV95176.1 Uncharacterised protein [Escherichia coli]CTX35462.1 Uncharacterised protein [Escherichia coli]CTX69654.1 Uncharacterised protein [Escherichia coli]CUA35909.1 Uncharacterised protein [Escherichia coli]
MFQDSPPRNKVTSYIINTNDLVTEFTVFNCRRNAAEASYFNVKM